MTDVIESCPEVGGEAMQAPAGSWGDDASQRPARMRTAVLRGRQAAASAVRAIPTPGILYRGSGRADASETTLELPGPPAGAAQSAAAAEATLELPAVAPAAAAQPPPAGAAETTLRMPAVRPLTSPQAPRKPARAPARAPQESGRAPGPAAAAAPGLTAADTTLELPAVVPAGPAPASLVTTAKRMLALTATAPRAALTRIPAAALQARPAAEAEAPSAAVTAPRPAATPARPAAAPPARRTTGPPARPASQPRPLVLPVPPRDDERYRYIRRYAWVLSIGSAVSFPLVLWSQLRLMILHHWFWIYSPFMVLGAIFLSLPLLTDMWGRSFDFDKHRRLVDSWHPAEYPSVDVFLPVCGEPVDVLRNTWMYVARMRRHYKGTVTPYVLDDSASPELKEMARDFGFAYATRPNRGWYKKSGNLLFGFQISEGDYILLLDADFAPRDDLLYHTLPYMEAEPDTGIVQTPQFFRITDDQTWVERGAGATQELFYRAIQPARSRKGGSVCVGSCAVYRRAALADNGGMTLAEHSEDILTGFDLKKRGWMLRYLPVALATGNCPDNVPAFLNQQYRWCAGVLGLLFSQRFWKAKLSLYSRLCYISGNIYYVYSALFVFVVPALTIAILLFVPQVVVLRNMAFLVPGFLYSAVILPSWHLNPYRLESWSVRLISGWAHAFAYWDGIRGKKLGWKPSGGDKRKQEGRRRFWICFTLWSVGSSVAWIALAFWRMLTMNPANFIVLFALGLFELLVAGRVLVQPLTDETG